MIISNEVIDSIRQIKANELDDYLKTGEYTLVDVRNKLEISTNGKIKNSLSIALVDIMDNLSKFNKVESYIVYCAGGYRSMIAASILKKNGVRNVFTIEGGISKIKDETPDLVFMEMF